MINRKRYLLPLMMMSAVTFALTACDDSSQTAQNETVVETTEMVTEEATPITTMTATNATAFATAQGATTGAVFMTIQNPGAESDRLIGASTSISPTVELHRTAIDESGVMTMSKLDGIDLIAGSDTLLNSDGLHIMLLGLTTPLVEGTTFDVTLDFEKVADVVVPVTVTAAGMPMETHEGHDGHDMGTTEAAPTTDEGMAEEAPMTDDPASSPAPGAETSTDEIPGIIEEAMPETSSDAPAAATDETPAY